MSKTNALGRYARAFEARRDLIERNRPVFDEYERIGMGIIDAENELRDAVSDEADPKLPNEANGITGDGFNVTYTPQTQTFADIYVIDALIAGGVIPASKRAEIVKTVDRPARISIRPIA